MIRHVVLIRWKLGTTVEQLAAIEAKASVLLGIEGIKKVGFHANLNVSLPLYGRGIKTIMIVDMADRATLDRYLPHSLHAELGSVLQPCADEITIVDFETD